MFKKASGGSKEFNSTLQKVWMPIISSVRPFWFVNLAEESWAHRVTPYSLQASETAGKRPNLFYKPHDKILNNLIVSRVGKCTVRRPQSYHCRCFTKCPRVCYPCHLESLLLIKHIIFISDDGAKAFARIIRSNPTITSLDLRNNLITTYISSFYIYILFKLTMVLTNVFQTWGELSGRGDAGNKSNCSFCFMCTHSHNVLVSR